MKKGLNIGDIIWLAILAVIAALLIYPSTHAVFVTLTTAHPYSMGFIKFFILASMGDWLGARIVTGEWVKPKGAIYKSILWGIFGMGITLSFTIFNAGVTAALANGLLPGNGYQIVSAFFTSLIMNITFGVTLMGVHRFTDTYIDLSFAGGAKPTVDEVIKNMNLDNLIKFVYAKTLPFFWVPAHTIVFMLPPVYRVLAAAALGIALGGILSFAKRKANS
ncbi:hypothetical protein Psch_02124 [Pelotomaculum schinkii]|uniref:Mpv17 / PMP22 family protein n=1 Tax=Pelotomaculum schinkii TaxID=78350 RepID=A0A4Y7RIJ0_9FIRM|nr:MULTISPECIES: hypothetical protein [Pelotomaculum]TEB08560.1 hypothetical protein Psch_02124 [Pelotomaculum schinkii]TEB17043.1 hypothetical protein Psfp_00777 [Pelotomaculum sp. FP]